MSDAETWAAVRVIASEDDQLLAVRARMDYVGWHALGSGKASVADVNRAVAMAGGRRGFVASEFGPRSLVFRGVALKPNPTHVRVKPGVVVGEVPAPAEPALVAAGLAELHRAGLVRGSLTLDVAYLRLTGEPGMLCRRCGRVTRHVDGLHKACRARWRREQG